MAELAVTDGMPPPDDLPDGECICTRLDNGSLRIDRADPRILISGELLDAIPIGGPIAGYPEVLARNAWLDTAGCTDGSGYVGAVLAISGVNQRVIYRIVDYVPRVHGYIGEWPD